MSDKHAAPYQILCVTAFIVITLFTCTAQGQTYKTLYSFSGGSDGAEPMSSLVQDTAGNLYGTTRDGGTLGLGTVFQLTQSGKEKVLHSFTGGTDGSIPASGLALDNAGNLYGTTDLGGAYNRGVVFKIDSSSNESVLHAFAGGTDGIGAPSALIRDAAGNLFSVTYYGGNGPCSFQGNTGCGTIFKIDASGKESVLYNFTGINGDGHPDTALVEDSAGNLYGAARDGEVFEVTASGTRKPLHILGGTDGSDLRGDLIRDGAGNLYGTAFFGGASGSGVVFKLDASGNETMMHNFSGGADGANPQSGLVEDATGNFYGTTYNGGAHGFGVVFEIDSSGSESVLYSFAGGMDGANPYGDLLVGTSGKLYGTTYGGGVSGHGTIFEIALMPPPGNISATVGNQSVSLWWSLPQPVPMGFNIYADQIVNGVPKDLGLVNSVLSTAYTVNYLPGLPGLPANGQLYRFRVTSVYSQGESSPAVIYAEPNEFAAPPHPHHPVLFLHGIDADASVWQSTAYFLNHTLGWTCGGTLSYGPNDDPSKNPPQTTTLPQTCSSFYPSGDFFTVNFGEKLANYPDQQGIHHQGDEVGGFIRFLREHQKPSQKLSVVAWSMGGLAARSYIQVSPTFVPGQIEDLITLGTPHFGTDRTTLELVEAEILGVFGQYDWILLSVFPDKVDALASQGLQDMDGGCVANGDSTDLTTLSPFLRSLDYDPPRALPYPDIRYVVVSGTGMPGYIFWYSVPDRCVFTFPFKYVETDLVVPDVSSTLALVLPPSEWTPKYRNKLHTELPSDIAGILCSLDPNCVEYQVHSPVDIQVTAPNGNSISNGSTSMPGAEYSTVTDPSGHEMANVLIPFPQGGQYTVTATPKPGAQPSDTFTILQIQNGVTTTIAQDMPIQNIPPAGFQTTVKNGTSTLNLSPESIDFGNVVLGRNAKKVLTLQNAGSTKASIGPVSVTVTTGNPDDFSVNPFCNGGVVGPGKQCTIAVHFIPHAVGMETATISIVTDASTVPLEVQLSGTGIKK